MSLTPISLGLLAAAFFITALLYAAVGFGGGSTYIALLLLSGVSYAVLPSIALICNIIVVSGGAYHAARAGHLNLRRAAPFVALSVPLAFLGGLIAVPLALFTALLAGALLLAGLRLALIRPLADQSMTARENAALIGLPIGGALGFLSGMVGIGGGIFLAPILYFLRWDGPKPIAATCSLFILVNSLAGLAGQMTKLGAAGQISDVLAFWPLMLAVLLGGQIGAMGAHGWLDRALIQRLTAGLILFVAARLFYGLIA